MRRFLYFVVTAGLVAATVVALASASRTAPRAASATGESANAYLPKGMKPVVNDWNIRVVIANSTLFSQLKQINTSNVGGLKVAWQGSYRAPGVTQLAAERSDVLSERSDVPGADRGCGRDQPGRRDCRVGVQGRRERHASRGDLAERPASRGISYSAKHDYVYVGQMDGSIAALRAKTGAPVWTAQVVGAGSYGSATAQESQPFTHVLRRW